MQIGSDVWICEAVVLDTSSSSESTWEYYMSPLPAVLVLRDAWVHISTPDSGDVVSYVKTSVNESFSLIAALKIPYINLDNGHV